MKLRNAIQIFIFNEILSVHMQEVVMPLDLIKNGVFLKQLTTCYGQFMKNKPVVGYWPSTWLRKQSKQSNIQLGDFLASTSMCGFLTIIFFYYIAINKDQIWLKLLNHRKYHCLVTQ